FWLASVLLLASLLVMTQGKNSLIALILSGFIFLIYFLLFMTGSSIREKVRLISFLFGFVLIASITIFLFLDLESLHRIQALFSGNPSEATAGRTDIWRFYIHEILDSERLFGHGINSTGLVSIPGFSNVS